MQWLSFLLGIFLLLSTAGCFPLSGRSTMKLVSTESFPFSGRSTIELVIGLYGETIVVPCRFPPGHKLISTTWKHMRDDGTTNDLLSNDPRVTIYDNSSLLISQGTLTDQGLYTCMVTFTDETSEYPPLHQYYNVVVYKKPASPEITDTAEILEKGKLTPLGTCTVKDAIPAADVTWQKNGQPLVADGTDVIVTSTVKEDSTTGLLTTTSSLQYTASKQDVDARFSCLSNHKLGPAESEPLTVPVHYPTERLSLSATPEGPYAEGDIVTLKCHGDGNPPPSSYNFHLKSRTVLVENSDSYTLPNITRDSAGEYKCSLVGNEEEMEASLNISVDYFNWSVYIVVIVGLVLVAVAVAAMTVYCLHAKRRKGEWMPGVKRERNRIYIPTVKKEFQESRHVEV